MKKKIEKLETEIEINDSDISQLGESALDFVGALCGKTKEEMKKQKKYMPELEEIVNKINELTDKVNELEN